MTRIGFLGAFSIDNAGDSIVGLAGRQAFRALLPAAEHVVFSPRLPHPFWAHAWDRERGLGAELVPIPVEADLTWTRGLDALIVGGGGIVNLDPSFRAFLLHGAPREALPPSAWNAVCSQNQPWYAGEHAAAYEAVRSCCAALRFVSVRNRTTLTFVRHCGYEGPVHLVPDPAFLLELPAEVEDQTSALLAAAGAAAGRPLVGFSPGPALLEPGRHEFLRDLLSSLGRLAAEGAQVVLFPWSRVNGDDRVAAALAAELPRGSALVPGRPGALTLWRLVGRMALYIGCRYHAVIAALAQDVPFVVLDEYLSDRVASSKTRELIVDLGLEPCYLCPYLPGSPSWKLEELWRARAAVSFAGRVTALRERLRAHYRELTEAIGL